jgi:polyhydroxyalkanoate synthesis regulator phasin
LDKQKLTGGTALECENLTDQEQISFLEDFIREINKRLDEITNGRDIPREIKALKLRIQVLECEGADKFKEKVVTLKQRLSELEEMWAEKEPVINLLQDERALYRTILNKI